MFRRIDLNDFKRDLPLGYLYGLSEFPIQYLERFLMLMKMKPIVPSVSDLRVVIRDPLIDSLHGCFNWSIQEEIEVSEWKAGVLPGESQLTLDRYSLADPWVVKITIDRRINDHASSAHDQPRTIFFDHVRFQQALGENKEKPCQPYPLPFLGRINPLKKTLKTICHLWKA